MLVGDVQVAHRQPTRVGAKSTWPIVVIGVSVSVFASTIVLPATMRIADSNAKRQVSESKQALFSSRFEQAEQFARILRLQQPAAKRRLSAFVYSVGNMPGTRRIL